MDEECSTLRDKARETIRSGRLPLRKPARILGGLGSGRPCALCGTLLLPTQMEFEIEFNRSGSMQELDKYHLHPRCFGAWEFEIQSLSTQAPEREAASLDRKGSTTA
jgi:hypothetical protein